MTEKLRFGGHGFPHLGIRGRKAKPQRMRFLRFEGRRGLLHNPLHDPAQLSPTTVISAAD